MSVEVYLPESLLWAIRATTHAEVPAIPEMKPKKNKKGFNQVKFVFKWGNPLLIFQYR